MPKWTIFPFLGPPQTYEAASAEVTTNGDLVLWTGDRGPKGEAAHVCDKYMWAAYRHGAPPFADTDPPPIGNKRVTTYVPPKDR